MSRLAAGIVAFRPAPERLMRLAEVVAADGAHVIVFANTPLPAPLAASLREMGVEVIESECNLGVGEALNVIALAALLRGASRVLLLDDDAQWPRGALTRLDATMDALIAAGEPVAALGPRIVAPDEAYIAPRYFPAPDRRRAGATPVRYIITSGSLLDLAALRRTGLFRADFFIDLIDVEWCFRAWARGFSCWCADEVSVVHSVGQGEVRAWGMRATRQPNFRFRSYARNASFLVRLAHVPWFWKARFAVHLVRLCMLYRFSSEPQLLGWIWREIGDGLAGKLGPPRGAEATKTLN